MSPRLKVSFSVAQRLGKLEKGSSGFLLGSPVNNETYVLGIVKRLRNFSTGENDSSDYLSCPVSNVPANINICGSFTVLESVQIDEKLLHELSSGIEVTPLIISFDLASKELSSFIYEDNTLKKIEFDILKENEFLKSFLHLRLTATIPFSCDFQSETVEKAFNAIQNKIIDGNSAFHILDSDVYILGDKPTDVSGASNVTLDKLYSSLNKTSEIENQNKINILNVGLYLKGTNSDKSPQLAPLIKYVKKVYKNAVIQLSMDSLAIASNQLKLDQLYPILVESALRSLELNKESLMSQLESSQDKNISFPETYHFFPSACGHFVSIVYPSKHIPDQLKKSRETFHLLLCLPMDRPLFRRGNTFDFSQNDEKSMSNLILNPHEGLPSSGVPDGEPCIVQGTYAYHHYMQDKCNDNGWGCAYRSLQTIFSWFRFQGYTNMPIPSHKEIQQCLVSVGDKPSSFVGSKQWIGSTEVSFVLDSLLGVVCRIVNVSSGEEMTMKGGELSYHFKTQGTPVMIGGGVLAHTILGVDYNKNTGAIKFLILDPHYTGSEDLKTIQSKGWCGWKGPEFWKKDAFYNMCLPLRPKCV